MMSEMICKNCGKEIKQVPVIGIWVHSDTGINECYPDKHAYPVEKCHSYILVNEAIHECEREYDHGGMHHCELQKNFEIKW